MLPSSIVRAKWDSASLWPRTLTICSSFCNVGLELRVLTPLKTYSLLPMYMGVLSKAWVHSAQEDQKVSAYGTAALDVRHHVVLRAEPGTSAKATGAPNY